MRQDLLVSGSRLVVGFGASEEAAAVELLAAAESVGARAPAMAGAVATGEGGLEQPLG